MGKDPRCTYYGIFDKWGEYYGSFRLEESADRFIREQLEPKYGIGMFHWELVTT